MNTDDEDDDCGESDDENKCIDATIHKMTSKQAKTRRQYKRSRFIDDGDIFFFFFPKVVQENKKHLT